jgi:hypothetical protein
MSLGRLAQLDFLALFRRGIPALLAEAAVCGTDAINTASSQTCAHGARDSGSILTLFASAKPRPRLRCSAPPKGSETELRQLGRAGGLRGIVAVDLQPSLS